MIDKNTLSRRKFSKILGFSALSFFLMKPLESKAEVLMFNEYEVQMSLINDIKKYCSLQQGLFLGQHFYTEWEAKDGLLHYVYVSKKDRIAVPEGMNEYYYFGTDEHAALEIASKFERRGLDTLVYKTAGSSATLLNKGLLSYSHEAIAVIVFHEALHVHLRILNRNIPLSIEEAAADVLAKYVAKDYIKNQNLLRPKLFDNIIKTMERIYKTINSSQNKIQNGRKKPSAVYSLCHRKIQKALKKGTNYQKTRFTYPINNAYFVRNSYYSQYYFILDKLYLKINDSAEFIKFIEDLPNDLEVALLVIESKMSGLI